MKLKNIFYRQRAFSYLPFLFIFHPLMLLAQNELSLDNAWQIALTNNYTIQQQITLIKKAREEISIQRTDYYPSLSTSGLLARAKFDKFPLNLPNASGDVGLDLLSLSVTQPIFNGFSTKNLVASAKESMAAQEIRKEMLQNSVLLEVGNLYYDIQSNLLKQKILKTSVSRLDNQLTRIHNLYQSEQATPFDTLEVANRKLQTLNHLATLENGYRILLSNLHYLLNEENLPPLKPLSDFEQNFILNEFPFYMERALQLRPEFKNLSTQKSAKSYYADVLEARYYPQISASFAYNFMKIHSDIARQEWSSFYSVLVNVQWELWNWKRDARKVQQAKLDIRNLEIEEKQLLNDVKHQITTAYENLQSSANKIKLQKKLVAQEKDRYRITEDRYEQGLATFLDLNTAELDLTEAETQLQENYITWYKNQLHLAFATGEIGEKFMEVSDE
jgi:outer membrane protein